MEELRKVIFVSRGRGRGMGEREKVMEVTEMGGDMEVTEVGGDMEIH